MKKEVKKSQDDILQSIIENSGNPKAISEQSKKELVCNVFNKLPDDSRYKKRFYDMLAVLDAGYISDRKADAARLFREIFTIPVIVYNSTDDFIKSIEDFANVTTLNGLNLKKIFYQNLQFM